MVQTRGDRGVPARLSREASGASFVLLVAGQALLAFLAHFVVVVAHFAFDACEPRPSRQRCDYALGGNADTIMDIAIAASFAVTVVCALVLRSLDRPVWWAPLVGSTVVVFGAVASLILVRIATAH